MRAKSSIAKKPAEHVVKDIRRATRRHFLTEDKIRIVLDGLRGEDSIADAVPQGRPRISGPRAYITPGRGRRRPKVNEFMEAGKRRLAGDTARAATTDEVKDLRREAGALKKSISSNVAGEPSA